MAYIESTYKGDNVFCVDTTGDCCVGDEVRFEKAIFSGFSRYSKSKFLGFELITGKIIKDSYGKEKQQHTFTLMLDDGSSMRIKGRNLYHNGVWRKQWDNEDERKMVLQEKHSRGEQARAERARRIEENGLYWLQ